MKKELLKILVLCIAVCSALCIFTACGESPISFKLNFIVDNEIVKTIDTTGNEKIALPNDPQKAGYTFEGWFWDKDTWEKPFTANSLLDAPLSSDMSVYAKFTKNHEHHYTATVTAPTCTEKGYTTYTCECGDNYKSDYVDELGHNYSAVVTEPTCTEKGYTTHTCSSCKDSYIDTYTDELEHEFTNYVYDNNATYDEDGTKTAICNRGCGATNTVTAENTKLKSEIVFKTLSVDEELNVYGKVANTKATFSFINEVEIKGNATFVVSTDIYGIQQIPTKTVPLEIGDNTFYITETVGSDIRLFSVTVRRKPIYTVSFNTAGGTKADIQHVEEDSLATEPTTTKAGYTFNGWDYDFTMPIKNNTIVMASWKANTNTKYIIEHYLEELDGCFTKQESDTVEKYGETDTLVTVQTTDIKDYEHFTHSIVSQSVENANLSGDEGTVLKVYYKRNEYTIRLVAGENVTVVNSCNNKYKYGYPIDEITANYKDGYLGYEWKGWHNGDDILTYDKTISAFIVDKDMDYTADFAVKPEMTIFDFSSTADTCIVKGIKDKTIETITVPDYVTEINQGAFSGCSSLESITIPFVGAIAGVTASDAYQYPFGYIFGSRSYTGGTATKQYYYDSSTSSTINTTYYIPSSLSKVTVTGGNILYSAFHNCSSLTSVTIPDGVTSIGTYAFYNCSGLTSITIPDSVASIGYGAFFNCSSLTSVIIPNGVTSIGGAAFRNCTSLTSIEVDEENSYYKSVDGDLYTKDGETLIQYALGKMVTTFTVPDSVTNIGGYAFYGCDKLTSITIPDSVASIGYGAFFNCSGLTSIVIADGVTSIGSAAFSGCSSLESITIPFVGAKAGVTASDTYQYPFGYIFGTESYTGGVATEQYYYGSSTSYTTKTTYYIPSTLKTVTVTGGNILLGAFYNCSKLTSITISDGVTTIGKEAFSSCNSLTSITIPDSVTSVGVCAFYYCKKLTSVTIGNGVTNIGVRAFYNCSSLTKVYYMGTAAKWGEISISDGNNALTSATRYYYSETAPTDTNYKYWHYDSDGIIVLWPK